MAPAGGELAADNRNDFVVVPHDRYRSTPSFAAFLTTCLVKIGSVQWYGRPRSRNVKYAAAAVFRDSLPETSVGRPLPQTDEPFARTA